jgi:SepF-like predicted cell division protein (DUF552 family)
MSGEDELIKDVEEEVKRLLAERRPERAQKRPIIQIYYFRSPEGVREEDLMMELRDGVVLIALKDGLPESARKLLENVSRVVKQVGGAIYLIKSPSILVLGNAVRLEVRS